MNKWFEEKFERDNLRKYTKKRLQSGFFDSFSRNFSITAWIIIINVVFFIAAFILMYFSGSEKVFSWIALQPNAFFQGQVWQLITSMFMHGNFTHLFVNMVSLFFLGNFIEKLIGRKRFFWLYIISGLFAGLIFVSLAYFFGNTDLGARIFGSPEIFAVGASGAIFALAGLLAVLTPKLKVYVFFIIPMQMWIASIFLMVVLWAVSIGAGLPIGNTAHLGGLSAGIVYAVYLRSKYKRKTAMINEYFSR